MSFPWQERTLLLMGEEKLGRLATSVVAVIGLGGVGAYAAEMLARAGVGRMVLLDSDNVAESNKNRQLLALDNNIGRKKVEVMAERLKDINPALELTLIDEYLTSDNVADLLGPFKLDYLVDAIDTLSPKLSLIQYCVNAGIPHVTSMGSGAKYDATKVRMTDLSKSRNCPLAFIVRKKLRKMGIEKASLWCIPRNFRTTTPSSRRRVRPTRNPRLAPFPICPQCSAVSAPRLPSPIS